MMFLSIQSQSTQWAMYALRAVWLIYDLIQISLYSRSCCTYQKFVPHSKKQLILCFLWSILISSLVRETEFGNPLTFFRFLKRRQVLTICTFLSSATHPPPRPPKMADENFVPTMTACLNINARDNISYAQPLKK